MIWAALIVGLCLVTAAMIAAVANRPQVLARRARRRVIVTTKAGATYRAVLHESDRDAVVLRSCELLGDGVLPVDGEMLILRVDVETIQIP